MRPARGRCRQRDRAVVEIFRKMVFVSAQPRRLAETALIERKRGDAALRERRSQRLVVEAVRAGAVRDDQRRLRIFVAVDPDGNERAIHSREIGVRTRLLHAPGFSKRPPRAWLQSAVLALYEGHRSE